MKYTLSTKTLQLLLPDFVAVATLGILATIFFSELIFTNQILPRGDTFTYFYPYWQARNEALLSGRISLWNPHLFMGVPFLANSQAGVLYIPNWPLAGLDAPTGIKAAIVSHIIWAGWGTYFLARRTMKLQPRGAFAAGVLFALGGYMTAQVEHVNQIQGLAWLPWILWLYGRSLKRRRTTLWMGLAIAMQFLAGHTQSTFITIFTMMVWALVRTAVEWHAQAPLRTEKLSKTGITGLLTSGWTAFRSIMLGGLLALGLSAPQLLPTIELAGLSNRSGGLSFREAVSFSLRPEYVGKAFLPSYGETALFSEYVAFIGVLGLAIVLLTIRNHWADRRIRGLVVLCGISLLFAVGAFNPLYWILVRFVPGFDLFRAPARWLVLWGLGASLILGYGIDRPVTLEPARPLRRTLQSLWPLGAIVALIGLSFLAGLSNEPLPGASPPESIDVVVWIATLLIAILLWVGSGRETMLHRYQHPMLLGLLIIELYFGGRNLPFNQLSSPTAWISQRPSISTLLAAQEGGPRPSDRFLSVSDTLFDPGDIRELNAIYSPYLDEQGLSDLLTATKQQEIIAPNLSMKWDLNAADGFDGGLLPLRDYNTFTGMFVTEGNLTEDGRLRENLGGVPDLDWLRAMSVRWIITDKVFDLWYDGVYYDLQFATGIGADERLQIGIPQAFEATAIGLVGHLEGMNELETGALAGYVIVEGEGNIEQVIPIQVGVSFSEGIRSESTAHDQAMAVGSFDPEQLEVTEFAAVLEFEEPVAPQRIWLVAEDGLMGQIVVRGATLIDQRTSAFLPLNVSPNNAVERIYSGDVKIYEYANTRPRFYLTCNVTFVNSQREALEVLRESSGSTLAIERQGGVTPTCAESQQDRLFAFEDSPEHYRLHARLGSSGAYLVINDAWYPGWTAHLYNGYPNQDWREVPIYRANGMFRAIYLPPNTVGIQVTYPGTRFYTGIVIAITTLILMTMLLILPWQARREQVETPIDPTAIDPQR